MVVGIASLKQSLWGIRFFFKSIFLNGKQRLIHAINKTCILQEIQRRGLKVAVAGIPKTIDNDIAVLPFGLIFILINFGLYDLCLLVFRLLQMKYSHLVYSVILLNQVIDKSFGFDTAVEEAQRAINAAHVEAESFENGIGLVKLMGRYSG